MEPSAFANSPPEPLAVSETIPAEPEHAAPISDPPGPGSPETFPDAEGVPLFSTEPEPVDPRHITVDRIASWIFSGIVIAGGLAAVIIVWINLWPLNWICWLVLGGWLALTALLTWTSHVWPVIWFRHLRYMVTERGLEIRRGVLWRKVISLPQARVQHTDVVQGPLQRKYGVATLVAHTAGTKNSTVSLEGVSRERAMQIRDFLLQGGLDDAV